MLKVLFFIIVLVFSLEANINLTKKQKELLSLVINAEGYIDDKLYNDFWRGENKKITNNDLKIFKESLLFSQETQKQTQLDAKKSAQLGKAYYSEKIKENLEIMKNKTIYSQARVNIIKYIEHAASGEPIKIKGQYTYINIDVINNVLSGIDGVVERLTLLFSKEWNPKNKVRKINDNIDILWHLPLKAKNELVNGYNMVTHYSIINLNSVILISTFTQNKKSVKEVFSTKNCIKGMAENSGITNPIITAEKFRGYDSSISSFNVNSSTGKIFFDARCIRYNDDIVSVLSYSTNTIDSSVNFDLFNRGIRLK